MVLDILWLDNGDSIPGSIIGTTRRKLLKVNSVGQACCWFFFAKVSATELIKRIKEVPFEVGIIWVSHILLNDSKRLARQSVRNSIRVPKASNLSVSTRDCDQSGIESPCVFWSVVTKCPILVYTTTSSPGLSAL